MNRRDDIKKLQSQIASISPLLKEVKSEYGDDLKHAFHQIERFLTSAVDGDKRSFERAFEILTLSYKKISSLPIDYRDNQIKELKWQVKMIYANMSALKSGQKPQWGLIRPEPDIV